MFTESSTEQQLPRVLLVAGAAYTGSTTVARSLAEATGWSLRSVGTDLRRYCEQNGLDIANLPLTLHAEVDQQTRELLASADRLIIEGRFLSLLSEGMPGVFRIQTIASDGVRGLRCGNREGLGRDLMETLTTVRRRDSDDRTLALHLYGRDDYLARTHYQLVCTNEVADDIPRAISAIDRSLPGLIPP